MSINAKPPYTITIAQANEKRADLQWEFVKQFAWQCCFNCEEFDKQKGTCKLNGDITPPPQIILLGCKDHMTDIPF